MNANHQENESSVSVVSRSNRRHTLTTLGAVAASVATKLTADEPAASSQENRVPFLIDQPTEPVKPFVDRGRRFYVVTKTKFDSNIQMPYSMPPVRDDSGHVPPNPPNDKHFQVWFWATQTEIDSLKDSEFVESIRRRRFSEVAVTGKPQPSSTTLFVDVVFSWPAIPNGTASSHQIAKSLKTKQLAGQSGIQIDVIKPDASNRAPIGNVVRKGQIRVRCQDHQQAKKVLQLIRTHPRVINIQWDKPLTDFHCPGCGLG